MSISLNHKLDFPKQRLSHRSISTSLEQRDRSKRGIDVSVGGFFEGLNFKLSSPSYDWKKETGGQECGATFGLTVKNVLDLKIGQ